MRALVFRRVPLFALAMIAAGVPAGAATMTTLYNFRGKPDAASPAAPLVWVNGNLYGTSGVGGAYDQGAVFKLNPVTGLETVLYSFPAGAAGFDPYGLVAVGGALFGAAGNYGGPTCFGTPGCGILYRIDPDSGRERTVYTFKGGMDGGYAGLLIPVGDVLYGTTKFAGQYGYGTIFQFDPVMEVETPLAQLPLAIGDGGGALTSDGAYLYGTTPEGGSTQCQQYCGTVFRFDPFSHQLIRLHLFFGPTDGAEPSGPLTILGGIGFGVTESAGDILGSGTAYRIDLATGAERVLNAFFNPHGGTTPLGRLTYWHGAFYGIASEGGTFNKYCYDEGAGSYGCGVIFRLDPDTGKKTVLYQFSGQSDGATPVAGLTLHNGALYGTTAYGGRYDFGTVFKFVP